MGGGEEMTMGGTDSTASCRVQCTHSRPHEPPGPSPSVSSAGKECVTSVGFKTPRGFMSMFYFELMFCIDFQD